MDTEKHLEIEKKIREGKSPNDEGPYYHHAWWESYKGGVKGKLGGAIIGTLVGAVVGGIVAATLAVAAIPGPLLAITLAAFTGVGMIKGYQEFGEVGKIVGSNAAQSRLLESRLRTMMDGKVAEIKEEIGELKSLVTGTPNAEKNALAKDKAMAEYDEVNYRKSHYAKLNPPQMNSFAFWKVALIGLAIGAAAGAILAIGGTGGAAGIILGHILGGEAAVHALGATGVFAASVATMGALGASFGINRDLFRRVFDKTDLLFKGITNKTSISKLEQDQINAGLAVQQKLMSKDNEIATAVMPEYSGVQYPKSETHFRDKVLPAAQRALLSFDHTRATPQ
jgi:hypothetical protein